MVSYQCDDTIATITIDDGKVNALSLAVLAELDAALSQAERDDAVVILAGRDGVFSAGFDLPVLTYRAMLGGVQAPRFWETGEADSSFRFNNYLNRFHWRHTDLMDVLAGFQGRGRMSLANMAQLLRLPGKLGFDGSQVWDAWLAGNLIGIRRYCETDVLNTWLVYLRFAQLRGQLSREQYADELARVRACLAQSQEPHFAEFLGAWQDGT